MPARYTRVALLAVGVLLVANPILVFPQATDPAFEYRAMEQQSDELPLPVQVGGVDVEGFACKEEFGDWGCVFDEAIAANDSIRFQSDDAASIDRGTVHRERFVVRCDGPYRRVVEGDNDTVTARLVPMSWEAVLENVSVERDDLSPRERRLLDERNMTTHRPTGPDSRTREGRSSWSRTARITSSGRCRVTGIRRKSRLQ